MRKTDGSRTLEESLLLLTEKAKTQPVTIGDMLTILAGRGRYLALIFLSLPFGQPIQIPGLAIPFGIVISFIGIRMIFGKHPWLPKKILNKHIAASTLKKMTDKTLWMIKKVRPWLHPRLGWICHHHIMSAINGLMIAALGIFLALPLPIPLTNIIAAWSIILIGLGLLEDDGIVVILGYLVSAVSAIVLIIIVFQFRLFFK